MVIKSRVKVNIGLKVVDQREDGYHIIHTLFKELDFHDTLHLIPEESGFSISVDDPSIPIDESNTCFKAWKVINGKFPAVKGASVRIEKRIPIGSGLGGGSSNAAAVLNGLNKIYQIGLSDENLEELALSIGADVPFFIRGGTQIGDGIGEKLTPVPQGIPGSYLLVFPLVSISTLWAYGQFKNPLEDMDKTPNFAGLLERDPIPFELFENDFEDVVIPAHPEISDIKARLKKSGAMFAGLSGSGSTVFGIFCDDVRAQQAEQDFQPQYRTVLTHPV